MKAQVGPRSGQKSRAELPPGFVGQKLSVDGIEPDVRRNALVVSALVVRESAGSGCRLAEGCRVDVPRLERRDPFAGQREGRDRAGPLQGDALAFVDREQ